MTDTHTHTHTQHDYCMPRGSAHRGIITSSRSAYYALSALGARHTGVNTATSLQLFKAISLSILSFGFEVWAPTKTEILMMERSQLKILRTILGVPSHVPSLGVHYLCGTIPISYLIAHRQLNFVRKVLALPDYAVSRDYSYLSS